jgi:replication-associated recombination protein RarA
MPSGFWDEVVGHGHVVRLLQLWRQQPNFSYLFSGPQHVGKSLLAEKFVRTLVGEESDKDLNLHPDVVMFLPEEGKKDISVEQVRKNRFRLYERPQLAERIVAYVPRLDRLNESGFNALLKVMEEPPVSAVFVSVADNLSRIPATILSRTVNVPLGLVPSQTIKQGLLARGLSAEEAEAKSKVCRGRPGLALEQDGTDLEFAPWAEQYASGATLGHRLAAAEKLKNSCDSSEDTASAWSHALEACMSALRPSYRTSTRQALILAQGIADAVAAIGGPLSPRLMLDAAALQAARNRLCLPDIYPRYFPLSLTT